MAWCAVNIVPVSAPLHGLQSQWYGQLFNICDVIFAGTVVGILFSAMQAGVSPQLAPSYSARRGLTHGAAVCEERAFAIGLIFILDVHVWIQVDGWLTGRIAPTARKNDGQCQ